MQRPYLLIAGDSYYPSSGAGDWLGCFETKEKALAGIKDTSTNLLYDKGVKKGQIKAKIESYEIDGRKYDWYDIVDLRDWTEE